jgi:hypothetical protein
VRLWAWKKSTSIQGYEKWGSYWEMQEFEAIWLAKQEVAACLWASGIACRSLQQWTEVQAMTTTTFWGTHGQYKMSRRCASTRKGVWHQREVERCTVLTEIQRICWRHWRDAAEDSA